MDELTEEQKFNVMVYFVKSHTPEEIARFIMNLEEAVDALSKNNQAYVKEFKRLLPK